jgi:hypothetical protein
MREFTREQGHNPKIPDIIGWQHDGDIEGKQITGNTAAAPAFPLDIIWRRLELLCFLGQVCRLSQGDPNFRRLEFGCHQIAFVKDIAESRYNHPVSMNAPTRAFDSPRYRVQAALAQRMYGPEQRGKHIALDQDREQQIFN